MDSRVGVVGWPSASASLVISAAVIAAVAIVVAATMMPVSIMAATATLSALAGGCSPGDIARYSDSGCLQRPPQASMLLAILQEMLLRGIRLVAIPSMLGHSRVNGIAILLQLITKLLQVSELFLLISRNGPAVLRSSCLRIERRRGNDNSGKE